MTLPHDYNERVYAGVLGKVIGVYLGRPFEGWTYERIMRELGPIEYYVHDRLEKPLIVPDDDITGTFTFVRALADHGCRADIRADQIGDTWLNYIIENRSILWWGGMGNSTEHTAFLRLKKGMRAPQTGSIASNGKVVAEQIGAQIFIDGWAMVAPGDPELAAELARQAGSVSHDGEAIYGAQVVAAMQAMAFVEPDLQKLQDAALRLIPGDSVIYRLINDLREWHVQYADWQDTFALIQQHYGYDRYGGNCHMVPNHALIQLGLLYSEDDFQRALMITNTAGWDTDCNSANVGCLMGIKNGLRGIDAGPDWRGPVADRIYLPTSDGGRCISDAAAEVVAIINMQRQMTGQPAWQPKNNARFHFAFPGAVQGFQAVEDGAGQVGISNPDGTGLRVNLRHLANGQVARIATPTFLPPVVGNIGSYQLMASPTLYSGQVIRANLAALASNQGAVACAMWLDHYDANDTPVRLVSASRPLEPGQAIGLEWTIPDTQGLPIFQVGLQFNPVEGVVDGTVLVSDMDWRGAPHITLKPQAGNGQKWAQAWVDASSGIQHRYQGELRLVQNDGLGMVLTGAQDWEGYAVEASLTPHMVESFGLACHVQGLRRYIGLTLNRAGEVVLYRQFDTEQLELGQSSAVLDFYRAVTLRLEAAGTHIRAYVDGKLMAEAGETLLQHGAVGVLVTEGRLAVNEVRVMPID